MIATNRLTQVVAVVAAAAVAVLVASCAVNSAHTDARVAAVPAIVQTLQTSLEVGGLDRAVTIHDVESTNALVPALILLHGAGSFSARMEAATGMTAIAQKAGFVVAYGDGTPSERSVGGEAWNAGACCAAPVEKNIDDIAYVNAVIDTLIATHHVDPARIYLGGFSNGGMMSYRAACEIGERLAGIVVVGGALNVTECAAPKALPVLVIHGTKDATVPYAGGGPNAITAGRLGTWINASVAESAAFWAKRDGCETHSVVTENAAITDDAYDGCASGSGLEVVSVIGGVHRWPSQKNENFNASAYIVKYFGLAS